MEDIKIKAIKSIKWTTLSEIVSRAIQPIITLFLARLLSPADFGVVGVAMIAIGLAQILQDFGLGKTLIQREKELEKSANIVFWSNLALSVFIYAILLVSSPLISEFFHDERVSGVLRVLCLQIILASFITVHQALLQRDFHFKHLFIIRLLSSVVPGIVSIPLALMGYGVWSLVYGTLAGSLSQVILFWKMSQWRPRLEYDFNLAKQLYGFSAWVFLEALLGWLIMWGDSIILGHFLGTKELGIYRVGVTFVTLIFGIFFNPILPVAYSMFSRMQSNKEELKKYFLKITEMMASISLPLGAGLAVLSQPVSPVIFGQKWGGIEYVIALIALKDSLGWLFCHNSELYRAIGKPDFNVKLHLLHLLFLPIYIYFASYGLFWFCIARFSTVLVIPIHIIFVSKILSMSALYLWRATKAIIMSTSIMASVIYITSHYNHILYGWLQVLMGLIIGVTIYISMLWLLDKSLVVRLKELINEAL
jgi:PST family polysaccharide transporter